MAINITEVSTTISEHLLEIDPRLDINKTCTKFTYQGIPMAISAFKATILADADMLDSCQLGYIQVISPAEQKKVADKVALLLQTKFVNEKAAKRKEILDQGLDCDADVNVLDGDALDPEEFVALIDYKTNAKSLLHIASHRVSPISFDVWMDIQGRPKVFDHRIAEFTYDPYDISTFKAVQLPSGENITRINTYIPPEWRLKAEGSAAEAVCPQTIALFLKHLFPTTQSYEYMLGWLKMAILDRCETALVINGAKGSGKGIFSNLFGALMGQDHFAVAPKSLLGSNQFNSVLQDNRGIYIDEFRVTKAKHSDMKRFTNALQSVERKGDDAESMQTFNSFLVTNNDILDMYLEHDDRRFSVLDTTKVRLVEIMTRAEIKGLDESFLDIDVITQFGHWVLNREGLYEGDVRDPYRGETFHDLVYAHLPLWQQYMVDRVVALSREGDDEREDDYLEDNDYIFPTISDIQKSFRSEYKDAKAYFPSKEDSLQSFVRSFDYRDMGHIGKLARNGDKEMAFKIDTGLVARLIENTTDFEEDDEIDGL